MGKLVFLWSELLRYECLCSFVHVFMACEGIICPDSLEDDFWAFCIVLLRSLDMYEENIISSYHLDFGEL